MSLLNICLYILIGTPQERREMRAQARAFSERHFIASPEMSKELSEVDRALDILEQAERDELAQRNLEARFRKAESGE